MNLQKIDENELQKLRAAGLFVSEPYPPGHSLEHGVRIGKPMSTKGNAIPEYRTFFNEVPMDAPILMLYSTPDGCFVKSQEHAPIEGPGDFTNQWETLSEAIRDILDFYLGDPGRMAKRAEVIAEGKMKMRSGQSGTD